MICKIADLEAKIAFCCKIFRGVQPHCFNLLFLFAKMAEVYSVKRNLATDVAVNSAFLETTFFSHF